MATSKTRPARKAAASKAAKAPATRSRTSAAKTPAPKKRPVVGKPSAAKKPIAKKPVVAKKAAPAKKAPVRSGKALAKAGPAQAPRAAKPKVAKVLDAAARLRLLVLAALDDLKAKDIAEIDVRGKSGVTDLLVIASGTSSRRSGTNSAASSPIHSAWSVGGTSATRCCRIACSCRLSEWMSTSSSVRAARRSASALTPRAYRGIILR